MPASVLDARCTSPVSGLHTRAPGSMLTFPLAIRSPVGALSATALALITRSPFCVACYCLRIPTAKGDLASKACPGAKNVMVGARAWTAVCPWSRKRCGGGGGKARHIFDVENCGKECGEPCFDYEPNRRLSNYGERNFRHGNRWRATKHALR